MWVSNQERLKQPNVVGVQIREGSSTLTAATIMTQTAISQANGPMTAKLLWIDHVGV